MFLFSILLWWCLPGKRSEGRLALEEEFTWAASIQREPNIHFCDGLILKLDIIMTACSVLHKKNYGGTVGSLHVMAGSLSLINETNKPWKGQSRVSAEVLLHPKCIENTPGIWRKDIALIKLTDPFDSDDSRTVTNIPRLALWGEVREDAENKFNCSVAGWGYRPSSINVNASNHLMAFDVQLLSRKECEAAMCKFSPEYCKLDMESLGLVCVQGSQPFCSPGASLLFSPQDVLGMHTWHCGNEIGPSLYFGVERAMVWVYEVLKETSTTPPAKPNGALRAVFTSYTRFYLLYILHVCL